MFIKICGTTNLEDAHASLELGADALGFIFAPSKRQVTEEQARSILSGLPKGTRSIGVFTEPDIDNVARIVGEVGLTAVQMHWPYNNAIVQSLAKVLGVGVDLWQVVGFTVDGPLDETEREFSSTLRATLLDPNVSVALIDAVRAGRSGGLGQVVPWERVGLTLRNVIASELQDRPPARVLLAGGLAHENVRQAIASVHPWGVDVVSGVEAEPGKKSRERLAAFTAAVRSGNQQPNAIT